MSNELCLIGKQLLTDIANAIRSKTGKTALIYPKDMDTEILSIETGLSPITVNIVQSANQTIKVNTSNISDWTNKTTSGTYSAPTGIRLTATITPANGYSAGSLNQSSIVASWGDTVTFQATPATEEEVGILNVAMSSVFKDAPTSGDPNFNETIDVTYTFTAVGGATPSTLFEDTNRNDTFEVIALEKNETFTYVSSFIVSESDILQGYVDCDILTSTESFTKSGSFEVETAVPNGSLAVTIDTSSYDEDNANAKEGDEISYDVNIENNGNLTINDIKVTSELTTPSYPRIDLPPGESSTYMLSYTLLSSDVETGYVTADAQATGTSPDPDNSEISVSATKNISFNTSSPVTVNVTLATGSSYFPYDGSKKYYDYYRVTDWPSDTTDTFNIGSVNSYGPEVGTYTNERSYSITYNDNPRKYNYNVIENFGTLTINPAPTPPTPPTPDPTPAEPTP